MNKLFILSIIIIASLFYTGCKKDEEKPNQNPTCEITAPANGQEISKGETVTISVDATDNDGNITEVRFFIDGVGKGSATNFPYNYQWNTSEENEGNHTIKATSIDNNGGSTSDNISVTIIAGGSVPIANFSGTPTSGTVPLTVNFTDQSTNTPTSWQWDFGDGGTSTEQNPSHTYNSAGTYTVTLSITNQYGSDNETKTDYITVTGGGGGTGTFTDPRDGQTYATVEIGTQTWMAENLKYLPSVNLSHNGSKTDPYYYVYGYEGTVVSEAKATDNFQTYGVLYNWPAALTACPSGWHLPSDEEWATLTDYLGGENIAGGKMKETGTTHWYSPNTGATNESGFTALPGGDRNGYGGFYDLGVLGDWWSATEYGSDDAYGRSLDYYYANVFRGYGYKSYGFSVRCVRD